MRCLTKPLALATLPAALLLAGNAVAAPFQTMDPRSLGMGGAGVAVADYTQAAFFNPSLLAAADKSDDFAFGLMFGLGIGATLDQEQADSVMTDLDTHIFDLETAVSDFDTAVANNDPVALETAANDLKSALTAVRGDLNGIDNQGINTTGGGGMSITIPSRKYALALMVNAGVRLDALFNYATADDDYLVTVENEVDSALETGTATEIGTHTWESGMSFDAIQTTEVGLSLAREFDFLGGLAIGITPKTVSTDIATVDLNANQDVDINFDDPAIASSHEYVNVDIGATKAFGDLKVAATVRDFLEQDLDHLGGTVTLEPRYTAGLAYDMGLLKLGADYDLAEWNGHQYMNLGVEFDLWAAQVRAGMSRDMGNNPNGVNPDVLSVGVGLLGFLDVGIQTDEKSFAFAAKLGFNW